MQPLPSNGCFSGCFILAVRLHVTIYMTQETDVAFKIKIYMYGAVLIMQQHDYVQHYQK
jgi:hypothetical protein